MNPTYPRGGSHGAFTGQLGDDDASAGKRAEVDKQAWTEVVVRSRAAWQFSVPINIRVHIPFESTTLLADVLTQARHVAEVRYRQITLTPLAILVENVVRKVRFL